MLKCTKIFCFLILFDNKSSYFCKYCKIQLFCVKKKSTYNNPFTAFSVKDKFFGISFVLFFQEIWSIHIFYIIIIFAFLYFYPKRAKQKLEKQRKAWEKKFADKTAEFQEEIKLINRKNKKNEDLLANMLPTQTANEIKSHGKASSHRFKMVTILFADIQGFTKIAEQMNPEVLIDELDKIFFYFDSLAEKYNIEKIKTIGDAYMCAGGIPVKNKTNPIEVILAALEMQEHLKKLHEANDGKYSKIWNLRIGIHSGPVIAGVVGKKKFSYDIWGDSVNVASRMESSGQSGRVNVSATTYELTKDFFEFEYRGKMPVKYKGEIEMYFVQGIKAGLSEFENIISPNKQFKARLSLLRMSDIKEIVVAKLTKELPKDIVFHNHEFSINFSNKVELLGLGENISDEEMLYVKTAALLYNIGMTKNYHQFIEKSKEFAHETLPNFFYSDNQIHIICELLESGLKKSKNKSILQKIFHDAYFEYFCSFEFIEILKALFKENENLGKENSMQRFFAKQLKQLKKHTFYTKTALILRDIKKQEQIVQLKSYIQKQKY